MSASTTFAPDVAATSTSSTTSKRVDWRNYDYSEGPPKVKSKIATRDVNPYSKRQDFPSTRSSVSNLSSFHTANHVSFSNENGDERLNQSYSGGGGGTSDTLPSNSSLSASNYLSARSFDESQLGRSGRNSVLSGFASPTNDVNGANETAFSETSLTYRPAKVVTTPPTDIEDEDDYDEEEEMRIPRVKCYGENGEHTEKMDDLTVRHDFHDNLSQPKESEKSHEDLETPTPTYLIGGGKRISAFEDKWEEAEKEQQEIERKAVIDYDNSVGDETNDDVYRGRIQFDDFAGDRSKASSVNDKYSDASVSRMEVPTTVAPVSILKNSGRFDTNVTRNVNTQPAQEEEMDNSLNDNKFDMKQDVEDVAENDEEGTDGDDSVFEFKAQPHKKSSFKIENSKRKQRSHSAHNDLSEEDDTSIDDTKSPKKRADSLKDRTKQAWSARNKATAAKSSTATNHTKKEKVSFHNAATVREFEPDSEKDASTQEDQESDDDSDDETEYTEKTDYSYEDDDTYGGRSMHSVYTKSYESETEDIMKDFFLIGRGEATNPGRRQLRYKKGRKELYREMQKVRVYISE